MPYSHDITLEQRFANAIKSALGVYFFTKTEWADQHEATDFAVFSAKPVKVAVRLRRYEYLKRYPGEFTIRWSRPSGVPTEIDKIRDRLVDYMFYGFVDPTESHIAQYTLCDLSVFRGSEPKPLCVKQNVPPDSELAAFGFRQFPPPFVLKVWQKP